MITKNDWIQYFPFSSPRDEQIVAIDFILNAFKEGKKYVIAECATGVGKSAIGVTVSKFIQNNRMAFNVDSIPGTWYLTTQKTLQTQYIKDFGNSKNNMKTLKSSNNYSCQMFDTSAINMTCAEIQRLMKSHVFFQTMYKPCMCSCRYREEKTKFIAAEDSLTNYAFFLAESMYAKQIQPRDLVIMDEAHTLESTLSNFIEIVLSEKFSRDKLGLKKFPKRHDNVGETFKWIKNQYKKALSTKIEKVKKYLSDNDTDEKVKSLSSYVKEYEILDKHICKVNRFISQYDESNWVMTYEDANGKSLRKLIFKPVDVSIYSHERLFNFGEKILCMSATILDKDIFCKSLGIPEDNTEFIRIESPFPLKNRMVHYLPVGHMSKGKIDSTLPVLAEVVQSLLEEHKDVKGIIHCVSFKIANFLYENVKTDRLLVHDSTNREEIIEFHCNTKKPTVMLSPSMMEGVDLKDDRSRFQIICKIPFPFLGDEVIKKRMNNNPMWYACETVKLIVQGLGRSVRNADDYAASYILDSDFENFFKRNKKLFPQDIVKSIIIQ